MFENYKYLSEYAKPLSKPNRAMVGRDDEMRSLQAVLTRPELCNAILLGDAGSGKALDNETFIPVNDERHYVRMGDIKVGDEVFDENGFTCKVTAVYPQGKKAAYLVRFADGSQIVCCDEHLWAVRNKNVLGDDFWSYSFDVKPLKDFMNSFYHYQIPGGCGLQRSVKETLPVDPYLVGVSCGDFARNSDYFCITSMDPEVIFGVASMIGASSVIKSVYGYHWYFTKRCPDGDGLSVRYILRSEILQDEMFNEDPIPDCYLYASLDDRISLFKGLVDTDGTISDSSFRYVSRDPYIIDVIRELALSIGYRVEIQQRLSPDGVLSFIRFAHKVFDGYNEAYNDVCMLHLSGHIGGGICHLGMDMNSLDIADIIDLEEEREMTCITVDSPSELYVAGTDHIVTHNTSLVQKLMMEDPNERIYVEVDLAKMAAGDINNMPARIKGLFDDVQDYKKKESNGREVVMFMDEFHQVVQLSEASVEALKPMLADSGVRGIKVIAATTYREFEKYISSNQPLVERLYRLNLKEADKEMVIRILKGAAKTYGVAEAILNDTLYEQIYEYTNLYIPANAQPRKSLLMFDAMIGWHRANGRKIDLKLLADVIYESEGVNVSFRVNAGEIKQNLDAHVFAQELATEMVSRRLNVAVADLHDKTRPMSSFLFSGPTGVGKRIDDDVMIPVYTKDGSVSWKRNGDLEIGDMVFSREGKPEKVTGVYHYDNCEMMEVELTDGRTILADPEHLWQYKSRHGNGSKNWKVCDTQTLYEKMQHATVAKGRNVADVQFVIPMNQAVEWPEKTYALDPYIVGVSIGNGCLTKNAFTISSVDTDCIEHVRDLLGAESAKKLKGNHSWEFKTGELACNKLPASYQIADVFSEIPELIGKKSGDKFIPDIYKTGSIKQRWDLIKGLFDTDGTVQSNGNRYNVLYSTTSQRLAKDIQHVLYSLGISSTISMYSREGKSDEYVLRVKCDADKKADFFFIDRKKSIAAKAVAAVADKKRVKKFSDVIGIRSIKKTDIRCSATCIMVDDEEHLYQAGDFIVTHNTELAKAMSELLFKDQRSLIRFDMTEYSDAASLERFRRELTARVWERPFSIVLLDEIEKACSEVTRLLLQVLDDARLMDTNNREVSFKNAYIIMTTNAGNEVYKSISAYLDDDRRAKDRRKDSDGKIRRQDSTTNLFSRYRKLIRTALIGNEDGGGAKFPPELYNRIDEVIPFAPLNDDTLKKIIEKKLTDIKDMARKKHGIRVIFDKNIMNYLLYEDADISTDAGGARGIVRKINTDITSEIARCINMNPDYRRYRKVCVMVEGEMMYGNKQKRVSEAYIDAFLSQ